MSWKVECGIKSYQIVAPDGTESGTVPYGSLAEVEYQRKTFNALIFKDGNDEVESLLEDWIIQAIPVDAVVEDVLFEGEDGPVETPAEDEVDVDAEEDEEEDEEEEEEDGDEDEDEEPV